jgi:hypothetical protein
MPRMQKYTAMAARPSEDEDPHQPAIEGGPERKLEHVEGHLLVEEWVPDAERRGIQGLQDQFPAVRPHPAGDEGQRYAHGQGQPAEVGLQDLWAGQPEGVARGEPPGEGHVAIQDQEERGARGYSEEDLRPEHGDEGRRDRNVRPKNAAPVATPRRTSVRSTVTKADVIGTYDHGNAWATLFPEVHRGAMGGGSPASPAGSPPNRRL